MDKQDAEINAENFIVTLLKAQPNLLGPIAPNADNGKAVADFINALHLDLTAAYLKRS